MEKIFSCLCGDEAEAIEKAELLGLRTGNRYIVITAEEAEGLTYPKQCMRLYRK